MKVKEGQLLKIDHARKGTFIAVALRDFDSEEATMFPVALAEGHVKGLTADWFPGNEISCRASLVRNIEAVKAEEKQCPAD